jgi:hypothetical protein
MVNRYKANLISDERSQVESATKQQQNSNKTSNKKSNKKRESMKA